MAGELALDLDNRITLNNVIEKKQENFLKKNLEIIAGTALDVGLKVILPDVIENQVIEIKNTILESGLKEGLNRAVEEAIEFGKSVAGIFTGKFENVEQIDTVIKEGGVIDTISDVFDASIKNAKNSDLIDTKIANLIKKGKNTILKSMEDNIKDSLSKQVRNVNKLEFYSNKWREAYEKRDFEKMSQAYRNLDKYIERTVPLENTMKEAKRIENLHNLIKNNGKNFDISEEEIKLAEKLTNP